MNHAYFRFHDELDYFLPRNHKNTIIEHPFDWRASIKDMIESLGVPHSEIELLVVNDVSVVEALAATARAWKMTASVSAGNCCLSWSMARS